MWEFGENEGSLVNLDCGGGDVSLYLPELIKLGSKKRKEIIRYVNAKEK